jgi:hypothetical protein
MNISAQIADFTGNCFAVINKSTGVPGNFKPIHKSEAKNHKESAGKNLIHWNTVFTDTDTLADSEISNTILIQVFKFSRNGNHQRAASFEITFGDIKDNKKFEKKTLDGKHTLFINDIVIKQRESFLDYVFGGCEIGLQIAVDFTASNGDP